MRIILIEEHIWVHTGCIPSVNSIGEKDMNVRKDYNIDWLAGVDLGIRYNVNGLFFKSIETSSIVPSKVVDKGKEVLFLFGRSNV